MLQHIEFCIQTLLVGKFRLFCSSKLDIKRNFLHVIRKRNRNSVMIILGSANEEKYASQRKNVKACFV